MKSTSEKICYIFAGVNGAGKTTLYNTFKFGDIGIRINNDEILRKNNGDWKSDKDQAKALLDSLRLFEDAIKTEQNINYETILSGDAYGFLDKIKKNDYTIKLYYIGVEDYNIAIKRVDDRVKKGGHGIAHEDIKRRYIESLENLKKILPLCNEIVIYDNTDDFIKVANIVKNKVIINYKYCNWFNKLCIYED